jgi:flagellar motility protein MotE (MotC chaperone)
MIRLLRDFRIIPVVLVAISALFVLKSTGLIFKGEYALTNDITGTVPEPPAPPLSQRSWARQMFGFQDVTGSAGTPAPKQDAKAAPKPEAKAKDKPAPQSPPKSPAGTQVLLDEGRLMSASERALLERLGERRAEIEARAKELEMRESVLFAAEKRLESRVAHLKQLEAQINETLRLKDENESARVKNVVTMYENMKPKDAARVFDRLDLRILVEVATQINPRKMSDILAQMAPESAERLTVELATRGKEKPPAELPRIVGSPTVN